jgi:hypothetical protein
MPNFPFSFPLSQTETGKTMKYVQAIIALGLFGWISFSVLTGALPGGDGGSSKTRALKAMTGSAIENYSTIPTALGALAIGLILALFFLLRGGQDAEA